MNNTDKSFASVLLSKLPYSWRILDNISELNPKYEDFHELAVRKEERLAQQSIVQYKPVGDDLAEGGLISINKDYHRYMYAGIDMDKIRRLQDYRRMAAYAEVSDAIDEICDESITKGETGEVIKFNLHGTFEKEVRKEITQEWNKFIIGFNLEDKGWELFRQFLIDGELYFENVISRNRPDFGVLGVISIPPELINPVYDNVQNGTIKGFILRRPKRTDQKTHNEKEEVIILDKNQVCYVHSGIWNEDRSIRLPYIENARRAYKQLSLIEDSIVIYRLVRAPERLVFYVDIGNMAPPKAEAHLKRLMSQYWSRKSYDPNGKGLTQVYDPQSMLDSFWFTRRAGDQGTKVETLAGGANLGQLDDLNYFLKKLYKALKVPVQRLNSEDPFKDGNEITREELRFAKFVIRIQQQFAIAIRDSFIVHLKLRKIWDRVELKEHNINVQFEIPTQFMAMREQQLLDIKYNNFNNFTQNESISKSYAQRYYLKWTDDQMAENREWARKDAAFYWEVEQIRANGPNFRDQQSLMAQAGADISGAPTGGVQPTLPSTKGPENPPEFGPGPEPTAETPGGQSAQGGQQQAGNVNPPASTPAK